MYQEFYRFLSFDSVIFLWKAIKIVNAKFYALFIFLRMLFRAKTRTTSMANKGGMVTSWNVTQQSITRPLTLLKNNKRKCSQYYIQWEAARYEVLQKMIHLNSNKSVCFYDGNYTKCCSIISAISGKQSKG